MKPSKVKLTSVRPKQATLRMLEILGIDALYRIDEGNRYGALLDRKRIAALVKLIESLRKAEAEATREASDWRHKYEQQERNFLKNEGPDDRPRPSKLSHQATLEANRHVITNGRPLRGGLPSLGKKR